MRALFTAHNVFGSLLSFGFDAQRAEQDDGVLECNRGARRVQEMPSTQGSLRCNAGSVVLMN